MKSGEASPAIHARRIASASRKDGEARHYASNMSRAQISLGRGYDFTQLADRTVPALQHEGDDMSWQVVALSTDTGTGDGEILGYDVDGIEYEDCGSVGLFNKKDAHLIAAAPDMRLALEMVWQQDLDMPDDTWIHIEVALAKARGEA